MYYTKVIFNSEDAWYRFAYGFKINMLLGELEITYDNLNGGYTTKGIKLSNEQQEHLKRLLNVINFKNIKENMKEDKKTIFLDPHRWSLQCIADDGNPILEIPNEDAAFYNIKPPNILIDLVKYIADIGIQPEVIKSMRFFWR